MPGELNDFPIGILDQTTFSGTEEILKRIPKDNGGYAGEKIGLIHDGSSAMTGHAVVVSQREPWGAISMMPVVVYWNGGHQASGLQCSMAPFWLEADIQIRA